jgi:MoaA/NifB/PqqE/SkfB family radical SAM enzyme
MSIASETRSLDEMIVREQIANRKKHWVRTVTACNSKCLFCLDSDTPRNVYLSQEEVEGELIRGREELDADKVIISGGEATLHPQFTDFVAFAKSIGYERVQTVTNGLQLADKGFYERSLVAGLGEITYSLHGHTPELHDHLTQTPGAFKKIMKAIIRSTRDRRLITNVDVVINKQNVAVLDKIVELAISVGVTEFDLLHVIPQAAAYDNRDVLFYDVREHLPVLHKVFKLNRHPRFCIWTNRFPVSYLEGLEDLIQDPHKMLDEVNGRRFQVRRYLDEGKPLDCRQPERCKHCFIESFCTTMERTIENQSAERFDVWWTDSVPLSAQDLPPQMPFGATRIGVDFRDIDELESLYLPEGAGLELQPTTAIALHKLPTCDGLRVLIATRPEQLALWLDGSPLPTDTQVRVLLSQDTADWMLAHRDRLAEHYLAQLQIHQPAHEKLETAAAHDVRNPAAFFAELDLPIACSGLPACLAPGTTLIDEPQVLRPGLFEPDTGRLAWKPLARHHIRSHYKGKSVRCEDCRVDTRCDGIPINMIRDQGLALASPLTQSAWADAAEAQLRARHPEVPGRILSGMTPQHVADSLPGHSRPSKATPDPLAVIAVAVEKKRAAREARRAKIRAQMASEET